jgi:RNA polymerase sigma factor (TIGR02999 family)
MSTSENRPIEDPAALSGDLRAIDSLFSLTYEELRRFASRARRRDRAITLSSTGLVHEAWLRLKDSPQFASISVSHFKAVAAKAMRRILIDEARRRSARKRGGGESVPLDDAAQQMISCQEELLDLSTALDELERVSPRQAMMIEVRFFTGMGVAEAADLLGVSESALERDWRAAKAWLASRMRPGLANGHME